MKVIAAAGLVPDDPEPQPEVKVSSPVRKKAPSGQRAVRDAKKKKNLNRLNSKAKIKGPQQDDDDEGLTEIPDDIKAFLDLTLRELMHRFGTDIAFVDWLSATQKIEVINEKRLKNAQTEGELISRDLVKTNVVDRIDGVFVRMLTDGVKTISSRSHAIAKSGGSVDDVRKLVEDQLGSFIRPAKVKMARALRDA
jgi:hypothetical protein